MNNTHRLAAINTTSEKKMDVDDDFDSGCNEEAQAPSFAVSSSFALLAQTPRAGFDVPATAESLPSDVLWRLATLLPVHDLPTMMAVCKSWRCGFGAAIDVLAPSSLSVSVSDGDSGSGSDSSATAAASFLARRFPCLRSLDLSPVPAAMATDQALVEPLRALTGLTRLSLRGCRALSARRLSRVLSELPRLRSLDLSGCVGLLSSPSDKAGGFSAALPEGSLANLTEFSADRIPWLSDGDVEALARALCCRSHSSSSSSSSCRSSPPRSSAASRGLVELSLDGAGRLTGRGLAALSSSSSSSASGKDAGIEELRLQLRRLSLAGCAALDDAGLALGLAPFAGSLATLVLDRCALVTGSGVAASPCFPALRRLSARDSGLTDAGVAAAVSLSSSSSLSSPSLSSPSGSSISRGSGGRDEGSSCCFCCRFPVLEELVLDDCVALTDYGVEALAGRRRRRRAGEAAAATTRGGAAAAEETITVGGLPRLSRLSLARLPRLQGWSLSPLFDSSESLTSLCLSGCVRLADAAAQAIGERSGVEDLDVSDCERVGVGFCSNLSNAPLVRLKASRCPRLSPAAIEALGAGRAAETLEELEASGCGALVTDSSDNDAAGAAAAASAAAAERQQPPPQQQQAGVFGGVSAIASALPNLRSLDLSATPLTQRGLGELLLLAPPPPAGGAAGQPRLASLTSLNLACCPRLSRPAVERLLLAFSSSLLSGGSSSSSRSCRVNSWGCKEEEELKAERPSIVVNNSSSSSLVLSFGHLSPQRGNKAAAAALAAAA